MKYTIIITVYNKEQYLKRCLDSVCKQNYKNYLVMVVNDGSTDDSEKIIKKYVKKYKILYYKKENTGVADTRNYAIDRVTTNYFLFVDADDYVSLDLLETIDNYSDYKIYGSQITTGTKEEQQQAVFVGKFLDIYENSYIKQ